MLLGHNNFQNQSSIIHDASCACVFALVVTSLVSPAYTHHRLCYMLYVCYDFRISGVICPTHSTDAISHTTRSGAGSGAWYDGCTPGGTTPTTTSATESESDVPYPGTVPKPAACYQQHRYVVGSVVVGVTETKKTMEDWTGKHGRLGFQVSFCMVKWLAGCQTVLKCTTLWKHFIPKCCLLLQWNWS